MRVFLMFAGLAVTGAVLFGCSSPPGGADEEDASLEEQAAVTAVCSGTEDFATDPRNCGACGHSCLGGACSAGVCQPRQLVPASSGSAWDVSVDGARVYYRTFGAIRVVPKGGGAATTLAATTGDDPPRGHVVPLGPYAYFIDGAAIVRVPKVGGAREVLARREVSPQSLTTDGTYLFWGTATAVRRMPIGGGVPADVVTGLRSPYGISADATDVWFGAITGSSWTTGTAIYAVRKTATNATPFYRAGTSAMEVRFDDQSFYFLQATTRRIEGAPKATSPWSAGRFFDVAPGGGTNGTGTDGFVVDGTHVTMFDYATNLVSRVPKTGGTVSKLATVPGPTGVAVDGRAVYMTTASGAVFKVAK